MRLHMAARTLLSRFFLSDSCWLVYAVTQVWSQSEGQEGFNPNLLLAAWHTWALQLHFPLIYRVAWMAGWREIDWRGNGLIVLTLTAGMQIALPKKGLFCEKSPTLSNRDLV